MVGSQNGPTVWNGSTMPAGEAVAPAATLGHTALKSGHSSALSRLPSAGSEWVRVHHSAVKKAPKNITSEKMNQLMLQRNDRSILWPYWPPSLSPIGVAEPLRTACPASHSMPDQQRLRAPVVRR